MPRSGLGYYQMFVKDYSKQARPLTRWTEKGVEFAWGKDEEVQVSCFVKNTIFLNS